MDENLLSMGESVDQLIATYLKGFCTQEGFNGIHEACMAVAGGPTCLKAADEIRNRVSADSTVVICTGFMLPPMFPVGENDGLYGAVSLAHAIHHGIGAKVILLAEEEVHRPLETCCIAAGLPVYKPEDFEQIPGSVTIRAFTKDAGVAPAQAQAFLKKEKPAVVAAIEKMGRDERNVYHSSRGTDMTRYVDKTDFLMEAAQEAEVLTIGIGDLGNEAGMGAVTEPVLAFLGKKNECTCGCGGGITTKVGADIPIIAAVANWGGYGIAACLSGLLGKRDILHSSDVERRMTEDSIRAGVRDGVSVTTQLLTDGVSVEANMGVIHLLHEIVRIRTVPTNPFRF